MSEYQHDQAHSMIIKPSPDTESLPGKAPLANPHAILKSPSGPGQINIRAQAANQLQHSHGNQFVQRVIEGDQEQATNQELARAVDSSRGQGQSLPDSTKTNMESHFDQDFSNVRVHSGPQADALSKQFSARAFTTGQDIFFRNGSYSPGSASGDKLLAHELTHVVQQGNSPAKLAEKKMTISEPGDAGEREADQVAESISTSIDRTEENIVQKQEEEEEAQLARQPIEEEEEEMQLARQPIEEEEEEIQLARQEEEEEAQLARQEEREEEEALEP